VDGVIADADVASHTFRSVGRCPAKARKHGGIEPYTMMKSGGETWIEGLKLTGDFDDNE
jgi:hypothetical protein